MGRQLRQGMQLELAGHVQCHQTLRTFHVLLFALFDFSDLNKILHFLLLIIILNLIIIMMMYCFCLFCVCCIIAPIQLEYNTVFLLP